MTEMEDEWFYTVKQTEDEVPRIIEVANLHNEPIIKNLQWMIPLCLERDRYNNFPLVLRE